jgi:hypothetical protein
MTTSPDITRTITETLQLFQRDIERHYGGRTAGKTLTGDEAVHILVTLVQEAKIDELNNLKDHYATAYKKVARKHGQPARVPNTAFHQLMYDRIKELTQ